MSGGLGARVRKRTTRNAKSSAWVTAVAAGFAATAGAAACGGSSSAEGGGLTCGSGTTEVDGECVAVTASGGAAGSGRGDGTGAARASGGSEGGTGGDATPSGGSGGATGGAGGSGPSGATAGVGATGGGAAMGGTGNSGAAPVGGDGGGAPPVNDGGAAPSGGDGGAGLVAAAGAGGSGTGGTEPDRAVALLGDPCSPPAALACAGHAQRVTLICSADGEWVVNQTCTGAELCSSQPGINAGSCQTPEEECAGELPGHPFCSERASMACDADGVFAELIEDCPAGCAGDGICQPGDPCLEDTDVNCDYRCGYVSTQHCDLDGSEQAEVIMVDRNGVVRIPVEGPQFRGCADDRVAVHVRPLLAGVYTARVQSPWWVAPEGLFCEAEPGSSCIESANGFVVGTHDPNAGAVNVELFHETRGVTCE